VPKQLKTREVLMADFVPSKKHAKVEQYRRKRGDGLVAVRNGTSCCLNYKGGICKTRMKLNILGRVDMRSGADKQLWRTKTGGGDIKPLVEWVNKWWGQKRDKKGNLPQKSFQTSPYDEKKTVGGKR